jgi:hypothetical protein
MLYQRLALHRPVAIGREDLEDLSNAIPVVQWALPHQNLNWTCEV